AWAGSCCIRRLRKALASARPSQRDSKTRLCIPSSVKKCRWTRRATPTRMFSRQARLVRSCLFRRLHHKKEDRGMNMQNALLQEFDMEMAHTRKTLERVPEKFDWTPHPKSMTMGRLAQHLAEIPDWAEKSIQTDELDIAPPGAPPYRPAPLKSRKEILDQFEK